MVDTGIQQKVERANHEHAELLPKYTLFEDAAIAIKHDLKKSGIKIELKENYIHAYFLDEELIFKYRPYISNASISGMITAYHRHKELDNKLKITPITKFYFDRLGNVYQQPDMKNSFANVSNENDVYYIIMETASKLLESDYFSHANPVGS